MVKPVTLSCGHSGCWSCLARSFTSTPKCPLCKKIFPSGVALNVNIVLDDITSKMDIMCTNSGCQWRGKLEKHLQHSHACGKVAVECQNRGCGQKMLREEMTRHISRCEKQELPCQECGKSVTRDSMREHIDSLCSHKRIPCPLNCGTNLPRCHLTLHMGECPEKAVQCRVRGCNTISKRKNAQEHVVTAAATHAVLQRGEVQKLRGLMHFKRTKPAWILEEENVFFFCWKLSDLESLSGSIASTEYRCSNGNRWRGLLSLKGGQHHLLSLQLVSSVTPVLVGTRIVLMPGTASEKIFSFDASQIEEGQIIGKIPAADFSTIIPDGIMSVKYVMSYYILNEV